MNIGYISLWRKLEEKGYYKKSHYVHLWVHLLLRANYKDTNTFWNGKEKTICAGQFITSRIKLSQETGIPESTIERILKVFENEHQIEQQKSNLYRLITITNYGQYQKMDTSSDTKWTTNGQPMDTINNINNINKGNNKNEDDGKKEFLPLPIRFELIEKDFNQTELKHKKDFLDYWTEKSINGRKERWQFEKVFDIKRRFRTWVNNNFKKETVDDKILPLFTKGNSCS